MINFAAFPSVSDPARVLCIYVIGKIYFIFSFLYSILKKVNFPLTIHKNIKNTFFVENFLEGGRLNSYTIPHCVKVEKFPKILWDYLFFDIWGNVGYPEDS